MNIPNLSDYIYVNDTLISIPPLSTHSAYEEVWLKNELLSKGWVLGPAKNPSVRTAGLYRPKNWLDKMSDYLSKSI